MPFQIRPLTDQDIPTVLSLFEMVFGRSMEEKAYRYFFLESPFGPAMVELAFEDEVLVGHYSVCPARTFVLGSTVPSARSMTTMTHPQYSGKGILTLLASKLYNRIANDFGVQIVWGFPNANSHYGLTNKLMWNDLFALFFLERERSAERTPCLPRIVGPSEFLQAVSNYRPDPRLIQPFFRDTAFFRWRYVQHPAHAYRFFCLENAEHVLAVIGEYTKENQRHLNIVETIFDTKEEAEMLLRAALWLADQEGFTHVRVWTDLRHPLFSVAERLRFTPTGPITYFGCKPLLGSERIWTDPTLWRVTMGDSDVF